jgi:pimeloyl-ACP methyl ester carboxylesterase
MTDLHIAEFGAGVPALFVHGSMGWGLDTFPEQRVLADAGFRIRLVDRRGFGASPTTDRVDFDRDAEDLVDLFDEPHHLVGQSYGAIVALLGAARRPESVLSLTVIEPGAFRLVPDMAAVKRYSQRLVRVFADAQSLTPVEFWVRFVEAGGTTITEAPMLSEEEFAAIRATMSERPFWEADIPTEALAAARFPKLVCTGGRATATLAAKALAGAAYETTCAALAAAIGARLVTFERSGHNPQVDEPEAFNQTLLELWRSGQAAS